MILTAVHQLRFILSLAFGLPFSPGSLEKLVAAARATHDEFGQIDQEGAALINGEPLDAETLRELQTRRLRAAARAASETPYYAALFRRLAIDPRQLTLDDLTRIPLTPKSDVRDHPDAFVRRGAKPFLRATTTGTTGTPTSIYFSTREMRVYFALAALGLLMQGLMDESDIVQISVSARGALGNVTLAGGAAQVGALVYQTGVVAPEAVLSLLTERHHLPGKVSKTSILYTYPSYLGALVEAGLASGLKPSDFGLKRIAIGGEVVTAGLQARARELFGDVTYVSNYGITELWGMSSTLDADSHLRFEVPHGLLEIIDPDSGEPAAPGQIGTIVGTPFPPFRETTMLLRYDTEDLVRALEPLPGTQRSSQVLGKKRLAIRHDDGSWTTPRAVLEALEWIEAVPLPARFTFYAHEGGVGVEVVTRDQGSRARRAVASSLEANGVPVKRLNLCSSPAEFTHAAYPLRGDLREVLFDDMPRLAEMRL